MRLHEEFLSAQGAKRLERAPVGTPRLSADAVSCRGEMVRLNRQIPLAVVMIVCSGVLIGNEPEKVYRISGFGGFPIDASTTSMWLAAPSGIPVVMAYFHGPTGWHDRKWKIESKFEKGAPGWAKLISDVATLSLEADSDSGKLKIQGQSFNEVDANTFLVVHVGEKDAEEKVIPLGRFELKRTEDEPASVELLRANRELFERIRREVGASNAK